MKKHVKMFLALAAILFLAAGCIDSETTVTVKKDGSGEIRIATLFVADAFKDMPNGPAEINDATKEKCRKMAAEMGEGVALKSIKPLKSDKGSGIEVRYTFKDISKVRISTANIMGDSTSGSNDAKFYSFDFDKSATRLGINVPQLEDKEEKGAEQGAQSDEMRKKAALAQKTPEQKAAERELAKSMLKGLRVAFIVNVDGKIKKTGGKYADKNKGTLTLLDINYRKLTENDAALDKIMSKDASGADKGGNMLGGLSEYEEVIMEKEGRIEIEF